MFIGAIVSYVTSVKDVGISSINGLIVSFLVYYIYRVIIKKAYQGYAQTKK